MNAIQSHYGETAIRAKFQDYVARFVRLAALYEEDVYQQTKIGWEIDSSSDPTGLLGQGSVFPDEATRQRELSSNASRIEGWRQTISYRYYQKDFTIWKQNSRLKNLDVYRQICKLKILRDIPDAEIIAILDAFRKTLISDQHIIEASDAILYISIIASKCNWQQITSSSYHFCHNIKADYRH